MNRVMKRNQKKLLMLGIKGAILGKRFIRMEMNDRKLKGKDCKDNC